MPTARPAFAVPEYIPTAEFMRQLISVKERVITIYEAAGAEPAMRAVEELHVEISPKSLARRIQEHRKIRRNIFQEDATAQALQQAMSVLKPSYSLPAPSFLNNHQPAPLTDIYHIDLSTDQGPWVEALHDLANGKRHITVMHIADVHFPFHHKAAMEVMFQLVEHIQPDVVVVGSDAADFALISSFAKDPDIDEGTTDVLDEFDEHWTPFIQRLADLTATASAATQNPPQNTRFQRSAPNRHGGAAAVV